MQSSEINMSVNEWFRLIYFMSFYFCRKKAEEECKKRDMRHKQEVAERRRKRDNSAEQSETSTDSGLGRWFPLPRG